MSEQNRKPVYRVVTAKKNNGKSYSTDIGAAWISEDGSIAVKLNALPLGDTMYLDIVREKAEQTQAEAE